MFGLTKIFPINDKERLFGG